MSALKLLRECFRPVLMELTDDVDAALAMIKPAQDPKFGDYQSNCAMPLAKKAGCSPRDLAQRIINGIDLSDLCEPAEIAGPGFINLRLKTDWITSAGQALVADERLGHQLVAARNYVVDYSSPNVAKPMHVGHLRSSVIGNALDRTLRFAGHHVRSDNHIGDWGTQFGMIIYGFRHFVNQEAYAADPVTELARLYRLVNQLADYHEAVVALPKAEARPVALQSQIDTTEHSSLETKQKAAELKKLRADLNGATETLDGVKKKIESVESSPTLKTLAEQHPDIGRLARLETAKLHAGDAENQRLWNEFVPECLKALEAVYQKLGIAFDHALGESFFQPFLADVVAELKQAGLASESDGAQCVFIPGNDAPFIVQKSDGAFTYATTDLATIRYRVQQWQAEVILYVVDTRQSEHFHLLFETARRWGYQNVEFHHVNFGTVLGRDGRPYKTRSGDTVGLESLLDDAIARAYRIVSDNDDAKPNGPELDEDARRRVAEAVGIGGVKYADLHHNRESDYRFDEEKMLAMTGDTATYIQYANARINGIFRKGQIDRAALRTQAGQLTISHATERTLLLQLMTFGDSVDATIRELRPNLLTQFLYDTANCFSSFYTACQVLHEEDATLRTSRLQLCDLTSRVLTLGLSLLGIEAPEKM